MTRCFILAIEPSGATKGSLSSMDAFPLTDNKELDPSYLLASVGICRISCYCMNKQMDLAVGCRDILEEELPTHCEKAKHCIWRGCTVSKLVLDEVSCPHSGSQQAAIASPGNLLEMRSLGPHPKPTQSQTVVWSSETWRLLGDLDANWTLSWVKLW